MFKITTYAYYILLGISFLLWSSCNYESDPVDPDIHQLIFPNDGETLIQGNTYLIKWHDDRSTSFRIRLLKSGNTYINLTDDALNTGEFSWTIPDTLENDGAYTIKILSNDDDFIYYESAKTFIILKPGETGSFMDPRDGQVYKTVKLEKRWWMAENFRFDTIGAYCYNNDPSNCEPYGRLYTLGTAKLAAPPGWHLPTDNEWRILEAYLGIPDEELFSLGFRGVNAGYLLINEDGVGFNALLSGYMYYRWAERFYSLNASAYFWTSTYDESQSRYWVRQVTSNSGGIERTRMYGGHYAFSVRYIKDEE
ncbi:MAG: hypothetical protein AMS23_01330 [Bacteroides sp. SM1_62]|nr:MAG: hypothetical protein AMS26_13850 [Bacteroides sp. SM23_62]KPL26564.1 MAG: hypothetical protein AMS23_01330 [Bacteroides sp. SM1_62]